jgi:Na+/melibiose symporter-like transporter
MLYSRAVTTNFETHEGARNFRLGVMNGVWFTVADRLMDPTLVLAAFVSTLTPSPLWLGLLIPITEGGWYLPQLLMSGYLQGQPLKIVLYQQVALVRVVLWTVMAAAPFLLRGSRWLLPAFFVTYTLTCLASGLSGLSFIEIVGKTVTPRRRGEFFAWRLAAGGVAGLLGTLLVRYLVDENGPLAFPYSFGVLFAAALAVGLLGLVAFARVTEPPDTAVQAPASLRTQMRRALAQVRADDNYRRYLVVRVLLMAAGIAPPFYAVYVQQRLGGSLAMVGVYLAVYTTANLLSHVVFGRFSARLGNRQTLVAATWAGLLMTVGVLALGLAARPLHLSGAAASLWLIPIFVLFGVRESGIGVASHSLLLDLAPPAERSLYVGFTNSLMGVVLLATTVSGLIVAGLGYGALFVLTAAAHVLALAAAARMRETATLVAEAGAAA